MLVLHRPGVEFTSVLELGLAFVSFSGLLRAPAAVALAVGVRALDELLLHARLVLPIVIADVVGAVASVPANLAGVELTSSACES